VKSESRVDAESQTEAPKNQETTGCRSQAGQAACEAGSGGTGREKRKGEEGKGEKKRRSRPKK
jgi:hypothetical protein